MGRLDRAQDESAVKPIHLHLFVKLSAHDPQHILNFQCAINPWAVWTNVQDKVCRTEKEASFIEIKLSKY